MPAQISSNETLEMRMTRAGTEAHVITVQNIFIAGLIRGEIDPTANRPRLCLRLF
jgi:hypothetical protein